MIRIGEKLPDFETDVYPFFSKKKGYSTQRKGVTVC